MRPCSPHSVLPSVSLSRRAVSCPFLPLSHPQNLDNDSAWICLCRFGPLAWQVPCPDGIPMAYTHSGVTLPLGLWISVKSPFWPSWPAMAFLGPSAKSKKFLIGLTTTYNDLINILSKIKQKYDKKTATCHK